MLRPVFNINSTTVASSEVMGSVSCSYVLSNVTNTSGRLKMSRLEWCAALGVCIFSKEYFSKYQFFVLWVSELSFLAWMTD